MCDRWDGDRDGVTTYGQCVCCGVGHTAVCACVSATIGGLANVWKPAYMCVCPPVCAHMGALVCVVMCAMGVRVCGCVVCVGAMLCGVVGWCVRVWGRKLWMECVCVANCVYVCVCMSACKAVCMGLCPYVCMYVCVCYVSMCLCVHSCMAA